MKTIIPIIPIISNIIGKQAHNKSGFSWSIFTIKVPVEEGELIYNSFTGSMVLLEPNDGCLDYLINNWFLVSNCIDEIEMVNNVRRLLKSREKTNGISTYTIFPTTDCNAKCYYCFERGRPIQNMSDKTAHHTAEFIANHCNDEKVTIRWFGGEPLCSTKSIDIICSSLSHNRIAFSSKMASNCLAFNKNLIKHAVANWNLRMVQVAIDGMETTYNKIKKFGHEKNNNAFQILLSNIQELLNHNVDVVIRLNIDNNIVDEQIRLVKDILSKQLDKRSNLFVYSHPLTEAINNNTEKGISELFCKQLQLEGLIAERGLSQPYKIPRNPKLFRCIADDKQSVTILPSGYIGLCEHYTEDRFIGNVIVDILDHSKAKEIREYCDVLEECRKCFYYPQCIRLKCCPETAKCFSEYRQFRMEKLRISMISEYKLYTAKMQV